MLATLLLASGFHTSFIALATLLAPSVQILNLYKKGVKLIIGEEGEKKWRLGEFIS